MNTQTDYIPLFFLAWLGLPGAQGCWKGWDYWLGTGKYAEDSENSAEGEEEDGGQ